MQEVVEDYVILQLEAIDEQGDVLPERDSGYNHIPQSEHDRLTALSICGVWRMTPDEMLTDIAASEFMIRVALMRAQQWSAPTKHAALRNREKKRTG